MSCFCLFPPKCWERAGYISAHRGKVYYTKVLLSVTEEDTRCPKEIWTVGPNSSCPNLESRCPAWRPSCGQRTAMDAISGGPALIPIHPCALLLCSAAFSATATTSSATATLHASSATTGHLGVPSNKMMKIKLIQKIYLSNDGNGRTPPFQWWKLSWSEKST